MSWMKWMGLIVILPAIAWAVLGAVGSSHWAEATRTPEAQHVAARTALAAKRYDEREFEDLPPPVQRCFRAVLKNGQRLIAAASADHAGTFNMGETADQ